MYVSQQSSFAINIFSSFQDKKERNRFLPYGKSSPPGKNDGDFFLSSSTAKYKVWQVLQSQIILLNLDGMYRNAENVLKYVLH